MLFTKINISIKFAIMREFILLTINKIIILHENDNNYAWPDKHLLVIVI